jgi:hypothetical protein
MSACAAPQIREPLQRAPARRDVVRIWFNQCTVERIRRQLRVVAAPPRPARRSVARPTDDAARIEDGWHNGPGWTRRSMPGILSGRDTPLALLSPGPRNARS